MFGSAAQDQITLNLGTNLVSQARNLTTLRPRPPLLSHRALPHTQGWHSPAHVSARLCAVDGVAGDGDAADHRSAKLKLLACTLYLDKQKAFNVRL